MISYDLIFFLEVLVQQVLTESERYNCLVDKHRQCNTNCATFFATLWTYDVKKELKSDPRTKLLDWNGIVSMFKVQSHWKVYMNTSICERF
jgi:hypothetical protein